VEPVDGNAIAGPLMARFGTEMTAVLGTCGHCGAIEHIAELRVYAKAPGMVARCHVCESVVVVLIEHDDEVRVEFAGFSLNG
jgi:Family of unknown function (DUF6510)